MSSLSSSAANANQTSSLFQEMYYPLSVDLDSLEFRERLGQLISRYLRVCKSFFLALALRQIITCLWTPSFSTAPTFDSSASKAHNHRVPRSSISAQWSQWLWRVGTVAANDPPKRDFALCASFLCSQPYQFHKPKCLQARTLCP